MRRTLNRKGCLLPAIWMIWVGSACQQAPADIEDELVHLSPVRRAGAVRVLAKHGGQNDYLWANKALADPATVVRIAAVRALAEFKDRDTKTALIRAGRDKDPEVRQAVILALESIPGEVVNEALVEMLLKWELEIGARKKIFSILAKRGIAGKVLGERMAQRQMARIHTWWREGSSSSRAALVRQAGYSVHPDGLAVVVLALQDADPEIVQTGIKALAGRGGDETLQILSSLAQSPSVLLRRELARALFDFSAAGSHILIAALKDKDLEVRKLAWRGLERLGTKPLGDWACPLLSDPDQSLALAVARRLGQARVACPGSKLASALDSTDPAQVIAGMELLARLGGHEILAREAKRRAGQLQRFALAALVKAGERSPAVLRRLDRVWRAFIEELRLRQVSWVADGIKPIGKPSYAEFMEPEEEEEDEKQERLDERELRRLYAEHNLPPPSKNAPRSVEDLLARNRPARKIDEAETRLFGGVPPRDLALLGVLLESVLLTHPDRGPSMFAQVQSLHKPRLLARAVQVFDREKLVLTINSTWTNSLGKAFARGNDEESKSLLALLGRAKKTATGELLCLLLEQAPLEKKENIFQELIRAKPPDAVKCLLGQLQGYFAGQAVRALGLIGDKSAIDPLRQILPHAEIFLELEILNALLRLGDNEIVPLLGEKRYHIDPEVRRWAVRELGTVDDARAREYVGLAVFDWDRRVRDAAKQSLKRSLEN